MRFADEPDEPQPVNVPTPEPDGKLPVLGITLHNTLTINGEDTGVGAHAPKLEWIQADGTEADLVSYEGEPVHEGEPAAAIALTITLIGRTVEVTS